MNEGNIKYSVAIVGAGPAGLFAARELANAGIRVVLFNRDIKPGGLAEYGIYPEKHKMKEALRTQFRQILALENIEYYGNVLVDENGDICLSQLWQLGFQAVLVTAGAQATKLAGIPGENLIGVYHAKDLVFHYNQLPPFTQQSFKIGQHVAIIGMGNVMTDIATYLVKSMGVEEVTAIARRGPAETKFEKKELERIAANLELHSLDQEIERATPLMWALDEDPEKIRAFFHGIYEKAPPPTTRAHFFLRFLLSPSSILGDEKGHVKGLDLEENTLIVENNFVKARPTGKHRLINVDTVIFAIGDVVDEKIGLAVKNNEYVKNPNPQFPVEETSYEAFDPVENKSKQGIFVAGWSRQASIGLVGIARKDGTNGARAILQYLNTLTPQGQDVPYQSLQDLLCGLKKPFITKNNLIHLEEIERVQAQRLGLEEFKFSTNEEMLKAINQPL